MSGQVPSRRSRRTTDPVHLAIVFPSLNVPLGRLDQLRAELTCQALSCKQGLWLEGTRTAAAFGNGFLAARSILNCVDTESALCVVDPDDIIQFGLPLDRFDGLHIIDTDKCTVEEGKKLRLALRYIEDHVGRIHNVQNESQ